MKEIQDRLKAKLDIAFYQFCEKELAKLALQQHKLEKKLTDTTLALDKVKIEIDELNVEELMKRYKGYNIQTMSSQYENDLKEI